MPVDMYNPQTYKDLLHNLGYNKFYHDMMVNKMFKDSGFEDIMSVANKMRSQNVDKVGSLLKTATHYKQAIDFRKGVAGSALMASLLNPAKGFADEATLAIAKRLGNQLYPKTHQQLEQAIDQLGFFKRMGAKAYGTENVAKDIARGQGNLNVAKMHGLPIARQGRELEKNILDLQKSIKETGDVDLTMASQLYDKLKNFNVASEKELLNYIPKRIASK